MAVDVPPLSEFAEPIRDLNELVPLRELGSEHGNCPLANHVVKHLVRRDGSTPLYRQSLVKVGHRHLVHVPTFLKVMEHYRERPDAA